MSKELRILISDDDADEVMQIKQALGQGGLHFRSHCFPNSNCPS